MKKLRPLHTIPLYTSPQVPTVPVMDPLQASTSDLRSTSAHLGMGRSAVAPQAASLETEVDNYLAIPTLFHESIIEFWQVCGVV